MTKPLRILASLFAVLTAFAIVSPAHAASGATFSRNAWIPYWKLAPGIAEARQNLSRLTSVSAFGYVVDADGALVDKVGLDSDPWQGFARDAKRAGVSLYATVSWFDGKAIDATLVSSRDRRRHVSALMRIVTDHRELDGIEIDYEGKLAGTKDAYSAFLSELSSKLHRKGKRLICDIEARTPVQDRYAPGAVIPASAYQVANDYAAIGQACDEVRVMAYDQGLADITLLRAGSRPYAPIADTAWVAKVAAQATAAIPKEKVVIGIPTYGRVYRIDATGYVPISSITYPDAVALAARQGVTPSRNRSGELAFSYRGLTSGLPGTATPTGVMNTYFVTFSDSVSIAARTALARNLGLGGAALFKLDGATDPQFWSGFLASK